MQNFQQKVMEHFNQLPNGQKRAAKFLLENPDFFTLHSAAEVGAAAGVSETTVIRFCYSLGYSGYSELQRELRQHLISRSSLARYQTSKLELDRQPGLFVQVMKQDIANIQHIIQHTNEEAFNLAVERLIAADRVLVTGMRASYSHANWLSFTLNLVRGNVELYRPDTDDIILQGSTMTAQSVLVAFSFHRYVKETLQIAKAMKKRGVCVIGITDSPVAPISRYADLVFPVGTAQGSSIDVLVSVFSFLNALVSGVSVRDRERFDKRKEAYESVGFDHIFYQEEGLE
ncbi:MurR/RpiR family transcriptional regulator [Brevibacillus sp. B_LB10_24]|uniref:MurR/RpiR family transcriptional regulator n=1 Tax=Brevibacillus sp. B_LB10_24 TaxID=3380645 RepID=UPI0038BC5865